MTRAADFGPRARRILSRAVLSSLGLAAMVLPLSGCSVIGLGAQALTRNIVQASYKGMKGQSVTIMVTADTATKREYPRLQLDIAESVLNGLKKTQTNKVEELAGTTFPDSASALNVYTYQRNYPQVDAEPITDVAPRFKVSRVIYIEIDSFSLNPSDVLDLYRGDASARIRVIEVADGKATVAYDDRVVAKFPKNAPDVGTPTLTRPATYRGTLDAFMTETVKKFVSYDE